jgi:hypothetical protein
MSISAGGVIRTVRDLTRPRLSMLLTLVSVAMWSVSLTQAKLAVGKYGIVGGLPLLFFVALGLLTVASAILWTSRENHWKLLLLQAGYLLVSLFMTHLIVGGVQSLYAWSYGNLGNAEYILRNGAINLQSSWSLWQLNWPAHYIFQGMALEFTGASIEDFARFLPWLPLVWQVLVIIPVFWFLNNILGQRHPNYVWAAVWVFVLGNWVGVQNNGSQPFGVFCAFTILAMMSSSDTMRLKMGQIGRNACAVLILAVITAAHFLASLSALAFLVAGWANRRVSPKLIIVCLAFVTAWSMYAASSYVGVKLPEFVDRSLRIDQAIQMAIFNRVASSGDHAAVSTVRIGMSVLLLVVAAIGVNLSFRTRSERADDIAVLSIGIAGAVTGAIVGGAYGSELFNRFFLFLLPTMGYFSAKLLAHKTTFAVLVLALVVSLPLSIAAQYGNQVMDELSPAYTNGLQFFHGNTTHGFVNGNTPIGKYTNMENYIVPYRAYQFVENERGQIILDTRIWRGDHYEPLPHYVCISDHDRAFERYFFDRPDLVDNLQAKLEAMIDCNLAFSNGSMRLYVMETLQ